MARYTSDQTLVAIAADPCVITDNSNGTTASTFSVSSATLASSAAVVGYVPELPELDKGLSRASGYAIGSARPLFKRRGAQRPTFSFNLLPGGYSFVTDYCQRSGGVLTKFALFVGVGGVFTEVYRGCKVNTAALQLNRDTDGSGGAVNVAVTAYATAVDELASPVAQPNYSTLSSYGNPVLWGDVRTFNIAGVAYRQSLVSLTASINHNLQWGNPRPDFGHDEELSLTPYDIKEGNLDFSGSEVVFDQRLPRSLFNTAAASQDWGTIITSVANIAGTPPITLTLSDVSPADEVVNRKEAGGVLDYRVPIIMSNLAFT